MVTARRRGHSHDKPARASTEQTNFHHLLIFQMRREVARSGLTIERPARGRKTKNLQTPANRRMKAFSESRRALARRAGLILLFDGEVGLKVGQASRLSRIEEPRRAPPNRYPDFGPGTSLPPSRSYARPVAVGVCSPLQWRNRPRFSRGSLTFGGVRDGPSVHPFQRTSHPYPLDLLLPREIFGWARQGSNLQGLLQRILSPSRLPIPPRARTARSIFAPAETIVNTFPAGRAAAGAS